MPQTAADAVPGHRYTAVGDEQEFTAGELVRYEGDTYRRVVTDAGVHTDLPLDYEIERVGGDPDAAVEQESDDDALDDAAEAPETEDGWTAFEAGAEAQPGTVRWMPPSTEPPDHWAGVGDTAGDRVAHLKTASTLAQVREAMEQLGDQAQAAVQREAERHTLALERVVGVAHDARELRRLLTLDRTQARVGMVEAIRTALRELGEEVEGDVGDGSDSEPHGDDEGPAPADTVDEGIRDAWVAPFDDVRDALKRQASEAVDALDKGARATVRVVDGLAIVERHTAKRADEQERAQADEVQEPPQERPGYLRHGLDYDDVSGVEDLAGQLSALRDVVEGRAEQAEEEREALHERLDRIERAGPRSSEAHPLGKLGEALAALREGGFDVALTITTRPAEVTRG